MLHITDLNVLITIVTFVGTGLAILVVFRGQMVKAVNDAADSYKRSNERLKEDLGQLQDAYAMQEKRIGRMELDNSRKGRQLMYERTVNDYFEQIMRLILPQLSKVPDIKVKVDDLLMELTDYRRRFQKEQIEWEEGTDAMSLYLEQAESQRKRHKRKREDEDDGG